MSDEKNPSDICLLHHCIVRNATQGHRVLLAGTPLSGHTNKSPNKSEWLIITPSREPFHSEYITNLAFLFPLLLPFHIYFILKKKKRDFQWYFLFLVSLHRYSVLLISALINVIELGEIVPWSLSWFFSFKSCPPPFSEVPPEGAHLQSRPSAQAHPRGETVMAVQRIKVTIQEHR